MRKYKESVMDTKSYELLIREVDIFYIWVKSCQDTAVNIISPYPTCLSFSSISLENGPNSSAAFFNIES